MPRAAAPKASCAINRPACAAPSTTSCALQRTTVPTTDGPGGGSDDDPLPLTEQCNGLDDDGDNVIPSAETDNDGDGYVSCTGWTGPTTLAGGDCNDDDALTHPGAEELCDGVANGCSQVPADEVDQDGDTYVACGEWNDRTGAFPAISDGGDCGPTDATVYPGAIDILDGKDNDCDTVRDECVADCNCGPSLALCYRFEENPSNTCFDSGPNDIDATTANVAGVNPGRTGNAYTLSQFTQIGAAQNTAIPTGDMSVMAWVNLTSLPTGGMNSRAATVIDASGTFVLEVRSGGRVRCAAGGGGNEATSTTEERTVGIDAWHHVACTLDFAAGTIRLFVDGDLVNRVDNLDTEAPASSGLVCVGADSQMTWSGPRCEDRNLIGGVDQLMVFESVVSNTFVCAAAGRLDCEGT